MTGKKNDVPDSLSSFLTFGHHSGLLGTFAFLIRRPVSPKRGRGGSQFFDSKKKNSFFYASPKSVFICVVILADNS